jgi:hypothetical protein
VAGFFRGGIEIFSYRKRGELYSFSSQKKLKAAAVDAKMAGRKRALFEAKAFLM